jgi:hypothetical protein
VGLPDDAPVDIEVIWPAAGRRVTSVVRSVSLATQRGRVLVVRIGR